MSLPTETCKNCEKDYQEGYQFCPHCGQKTKDDLTLGVLFYNTIANYFSFDARFFKSFIPLMFRPGYLAKRFIEGKRMLYLHPAQLYLFVSVIFFFIFSFSVRQQVNAVNKELTKTLEKKNALDTISDRKVRDSIKIANVIAELQQDSIARQKARKALMNNRKWTGISEAQIDSMLLSDKSSNKNSNRGNFNFGNFDSKVVDSLIAYGASDKDIYKHFGADDNSSYFKRKFYAQALKFYKNRQGGSIVQAFYDTVPIAMFFLLPIFAFLLKLFYYNRGRYAHHLVFSFYFFSFLFTVLAIVFGVNKFWDVPDGLDWIIVLSTFIYFMFALRYFYKQHWLLTIFKSGVITFMFMLIIIPISLFFMVIFAFLFY